MTFARRLCLYLVLAASLATLSIHTRHFFLLHSKSDGPFLADGRTIGYDFPCFYFAGWAYRTDPALIYDHARLHEEQRKLFRGKDGPGLLAFVYPPLVAVAFSPLSRLPYVEAAYLWHALTLAMAVAALLIVMRASGARGLPAAAAFFAALSYVPLSVYCIVGAQTSSFGLLVLAGMYAARKSGKEFLSGFILSLASYKPPPFVGVVLFQFVARRHTLLKGFVLGVAVLAAATWAAVGAEGITNFLGAISSYGHGKELLPGYVHRSEMGSGFMSYLLEVFAGAPLIAQTIFFIVATLLFILATLARHRTEEMRFSLEIACSLFISVWLMHYEYALLSLPMFLLIVELAKRPFTNASLGIIIPLSGLYVSYLLPRIQLFGGALRPDAFFLFLLIAGLLHFEKQALR